jgi:hypothetical protein
MGGAVQAQEATGRVVGRVSDQDTGLPLGGVTVIMQGPQGEDATLTDDRGDYAFTSLRVGTYVIRFYVANASAQVEQPGVNVSADKTVRVNAKINSKAQAAAQQTYVITGKAPAVDVGSARVGTTFNRDFARYIPNGITYGDVISKAPGAFVDPSGNVSIGGATGLENIYIINGLNVTGLEYGNLENGASSIAGGTNIPLEFVTQIDVNSGGYQAEFGGAMGGVINTVLRSGTNEWHGSAWLTWDPYWMATDPKVVLPLNNALGAIRKPDFDDSIGVEAGGPLIKDKLFLWVGFAPRITNSHVFRLTYAQEEDPSNPGQAKLDASGRPVLKELQDWRARIDETHRTYYYAATVDWIPRAEHKLTFNVLGSPSFNTEVRQGLNGAGNIGQPDWMTEALTKSNTDLMAHWVSHFFDNHWQLDLSAGLHNEYFFNRSPNEAANSLNQLEYSGSNLYDLEHAPGCAPTADGFQPCPLNQNYWTGGFGLVKKYTGNRYSTEIKSTHNFEAGGHHEVKYGWHFEAATFDQDRYYSGPIGSRALVQFFPGSPDPTTGSFNNTTFFTLPPGQHSTDYTVVPPLRSTSALLFPPAYQDDLKAYVKSLSHAFFLQDSYSPKPVRNLTINAGARVELQQLEDYHAYSFLNTTNFGPRIGAIYDPFSDGRSKVSVAYGRYYEAVPLDIAARYFGGENFLTRNNTPLSSCNGSFQNPYNWTGAGEWKSQCPFPMNGTVPDPGPGNGAMPTFNSEQAQKGLQGQYHNEIVATLEREIFEDTTARVDYEHRWLGNIIEDGAADTLGATFVLANPGNVPQSAIDDAQHQVDLAQAQVNANPTDLAAQSNLAAAQGKLTSLTGLKGAPKPERTYDAITLTLAKRFSKNWFARAAYTYSRLIGNYEGLFQAEQSYFAPNGNNAYDFPELYINQNGPLPNDRPHNFHLDGFYGHDVGKGRITFGLSFLAQSGMPRNYVSALIQNQQLVMLLPRGSAGRTPTVTELDGKIAYSRQLAPKVRMDAFIDLFNIFNEQTALLTDDNYTFEPTAPIVNGTPQDLKFAKNIGGAPVTKNANFGQPLAYQVPFHGRLGLRLTF